MTLYDIRYNRLNKFINKLHEFEKHNNITLDNIKYIMKEWKIILKQQLLNFGWKFNNTLLDDIYRWGSNGYNWTKLHSKKKDEYKTIQTYIKHFSGELEYCSDRMSIDRLFRCHWEYNNLLEGFVKFNNYLTYSYENIIFKRTIYDIQYLFKKQTIYNISICKHCLKNIDQKLKLNESFITSVCEICNKNNSKLQLEIPNNKRYKVKLIKN